MNGGYRMPFVKNLRCTFVFAIMLLASINVAAQSQPAAPLPINTLVPTVADAVKAAETSRDSLTTLVKAYEQETEHLAQKNAQLKELFADGIVSRSEIEASDKALAEGRKKIEDAREQVKEADAAILAAKNPPAVALAELKTFNYANGAQPAWTTGNQSVDSLIRLYGGKYEVDPYLIYCVMHQESRFSTGAVSNKGARGLMQLMPATAARFGVTNPHNAAQSIMAGARYLKFLLGLFGGRVDLALAGYNAGEGAVQKYGNRVPPYAETQNYVQSIGSRYAQGAGVQLVNKTYIKKT
jgi:soluble lytic murein transglycosylase-like protein